MTIQLIIDVRESRLCAELTRLGVPYNTQALDVGDILIQTAEGDPLLVAERKSHADFAASNQDGRYREQRARLMAVRGGGCAVLYILEGLWTGNPDRLIGGGGRVTEGLLQRLTSRLILRYGMPVLASASLAETATWCRVLLSQLTDDATVFKPEEGMAAATTAAMASMTASLSTVKKANKTAGGTAAAMLSAVPGMGPKRIQELLAVKTIAELATMEVAAIAETTVGGKRLGPAVAQALHDALHTKNI